MTDGEFAQLEQETWHLYEEHVDLFRIRGFRIAMARQVDLRKQRVQKALDAVERARKKAEKEIATLHAACDLEERFALFAARASVGDVKSDIRREVAEAIEDLCG